MTDFSVNMHALDAGWVPDAATADQVPAGEFAAVQLLPSVTEPQRRALRHFAGERQYDSIVSTTGEKVVTAEWHPNARIVRALIDKRLLVGVRGTRERSGTAPKLRCQLSDLGKTIVDSDRGYAVRRDPSGDWTAVCASAKAVNKAKTDKLRNPRLRFASIVREESSGIVVGHLAWTRKNCGEFGWG